MFVDPENLVEYRQKTDNYASVQTFLDLYVINKGVNT